MGLLGNLLGMAVGAGGGVAGAHNAHLAEIALQRVTEPYKQTIYKKMIEMAGAASGRQIPEKQFWDLFNGHDRICQLNLVAMALNNLDYHVLSGDSWINIKNPFMLVVTKKDLEINSFHLFKKYKIKAFIHSGKIDIRDWLNVGTIKEKEKKLIEKRNVLDQKSSQENFPCETQQTQQTVPISVMDKCFEKALFEFENEKTNKASLSRAIADSEGDPAKEKSFYIKFRVEQLEKKAEQIIEKKQKDKIEQRQAEKGKRAMDEKRAAEIRIAEIERWSEERRLAEEKKTGQGKKVS